MEKFVTVNGWMNVCYYLTQNYRTDCMGRKLEIRNKTLAMYSDLIGFEITYYIYETLRHSC